MFGPLGLILFVLGCIYYARRGQLGSLSPAEFPHASPDQFEEWRRLELRSIDVFLRVTALLFLMSLFGSLALAFIDPHGRAPNPAAVIGMVAVGVVSVLAFLVGLTASAILGSKAARLRKSLGIDWPKRRGSQAA